MKTRPRSLLIVCLCSTVMLSSETTNAQAPAKPATVWSFLGIPQGAKRVSDNWTNRGGRFPGMEKKPPLKKIADPENLKSDNPAIKKAAEIKKEEDLAKQKIKAVKYLASIGCGCYNRDGGITDALMAAMGDCTEEVRLATIQSIGEAASSDACEHCKHRSCCSEEITKKLYEIAYGRDDSGCFLEPSERVREAAKDAMYICCPGHDGEIAPETDGGGLQLESTPASPGIAPEGTPTPAPPTPEASSSTGLLRKMPREATVAQSKGVHASISSPISEEEVPVIKPTEAKLRKPVRFVGLSDEESATESASSDEKPIAHAATTKASSRKIGAPVEVRKGIVYQVNPQQGTIDVRFDDGESVSESSRLIAFHTYAVLGRTAVAHLEVVEARDGEATLRTTGSIRAMKVSVGDEVEVRH